MDSIRPAERMASSRRKYQQQGLRLVSMWIPDTRLTDFAQQARQQCVSLHSNNKENESQDWLENAADRDGWEA